MWTGSTHSLWYFDIIQNGDTVLERLALLPGVSGSTPGQTQSSSPSQTGFSLAACIKVSKFPQDVTVRVDLVCALQWTGALSMVHSSILKKTLRY